MAKQESAATESGKSSKYSGIKAMTPLAPGKRSALDTPINKYDLILFARRWAYELRSKEGETRPLQELLLVSIDDILSKRVDPETIRELPEFSFKKLKNGPSSDFLDAITPIVEEEVDAAIHARSGKKVAKKTKED